MFGSILLICDRSDRTSTTVPETRRGLDDARCRTRSIDARHVSCAATTRSTLSAELPGDLVEDGDSISGRAIIAALSPDGMARRQAWTVTMAIWREVPLWKQSWWS